MSQYKPRQNKGRTSELYSRGCQHQWQKEMYGRKKCKKCGIVRSIHKKTREERLAEEHQKLQRLRAGIRGGGGQ